MLEGRETWEFTRDEIIAILRREVGRAAPRRAAPRRAAPRRASASGSFVLWGIAPGYATDRAEQHITLVRDYEA